MSGHDAWEDRFSIRRIGKLIRSDAEGYLVNHCCIERIRPPWSDAVRCAVEQYRRAVGEALHSVYVRGSVAQGTALRHVSDLDTFALLEEADDLDSDWESLSEEWVQEQFPFLNGVEMTGLSRNALLTAPDLQAWRFRAKIQSCCAWGDSVIPLLPPQRADRGMIWLLWHLDELVGEFEEERRAHDRGEGPPACWMWIFKILIRAGLELVIERARVFSRDLYPCYEIFARYYPERREDMWRALEWAVREPADPEVAASLMHELAAWLGDEARRTFDSKPGEAVDRG